MEIKNNDLKVGDIMVSTWGATMILADFVEVVKILPKTLLVESLESKSVSGMIDGIDYKPEYGRPWVVPDGNKRRHIQRAHGEPEKIRLYCKRMTNQDETVNEVWFSKVRRFAKIYEKWDGRPIQEDHND